MRASLHGSYDRVAEGDGEDGPPHHGLIDVYSPGHQDVADQKGIASPLQSDVVVEFSEWRGAYLLAR